MARAIAEPAPPAAFDGLGALVRTHREQAGLSLRALAERIGVSASLLSRIENGKARPSVTTLYGLTAELHLSLDDLAGRPASSHAGPGAATGVQVRRAADGPSLPMGVGVHWTLLNPLGEPDVELLSLTYDVGASSSEDGALVTHAGRETGLVVSGTLHVTVEPETLVLGPGDSVSFDSATPHRFWNEGTEPVRAVWLNVGRGAGRAGRVRRREPHGPVAQ